MCFIKGLDASGYLKHVKAVMEASIFIAEAIQEQNINTNISLKNFGTLKLD